MVPLRDCLVEEPLLHRRQRHRATRRPLVNQRLLAAAGGLGQAANRLVLEQILGAQHDAGLPRAADHLHGNDGVAAQFEEVVFQTDAVESQHVLPDHREGLFHDRARRYVLALLWRAIDGRQGLAVKLAVGRQRQLCEEQQGRRDHVVRQMLAQRGLEAFTQVGLRIEVVQQRRIAGHDVGDQLLPVDTVLRQHCQLADGCLLQQPRFDFSQLDTKAPHFDLMVDAPDVLQRTIGLIAGQVAGAVQALAVAGERVGHVLFGGHARACEVTAGDACAAHVQLGGHPLRHGLQVGVQQIAGAVLEWSADVRAAARLTASPGGIGGVFRRAVQIVHVLHARLLVQRLDQALLQRFARKVDDAHARRNLVLALQGTDSRRYSVDQAHLITGRELRQFQGVTGDDQRAAVGQGYEQLPD